MINKQLVQQCDVLVGVFWTRLGTATGVAESGSAEEIEEFRKAGKPVLLYFSSAPVVPESIDLDQYHALIEYKKKLQSEGLVFSYNSVGEFRQILQGHLSTTIGMLLEQSGRNSNTINAAAQSKQAQATKMFKAQIEAFLRRFEADWSAERDIDPLGIDEGKYILRNAQSQVLDFKAQIEEDKGSELSSILQNALKQLKELDRHKLRLDGGISYQEFWKRGNEVLELLKRIPIELQKVVPKDDIS
ncbi:MAG: hypothetical protein HGA43_10295 [Nitrospirae bacterium]|nr:hypothetical protein [Nitrospirota bacterium]